MKEHRYYVYIIANATRLIYIGFTSNLRKRIWEHKNKRFAGYSSHFHVCRLVYFEVHGEVNLAISREKQLKRWRREKKIALIEMKNRNWDDLSREWFEEPKSS